MIYGVNMFYVFHESQALIAAAKLRLFGKLNSELNFARRCEVKKGKGQLYKWKTVLQDRNTQKMERKSFTLVLFLHSIGLFVVSPLPIANGIFYLISDITVPLDNQFNGWAGFVTGSLGMVTAVFGIIFSRHSEIKSAMQKYKIVVLLVMYLYKFLLII